jgi:hypothetical protein
MCFLPKGGGEEKEKERKIQTFAFLIQVKVYQDFSLLDCTIYPLFAFGNVTNDKYHLYHFTNFHLLCHLSQKVSIRIFSLVMLAT